ncbi:helix-turn-helix domain-containing protein [Ramlibacter sp. Leaf400]|uniref:helix-turn-helix domain-containing protein n=1 Tax=Ramlibacter sp. Leaf400 TaxID=1736365 RepID=UPI0006F7CEA7|nr:helix-turn-helix domain-containing protein [Ramlibacter sp. Leaf400]KQT13657.1 histidine kinase [Ramlibacter sp. Leaf400]
MPATDQIRLQEIERARRAVMGEGRGATDGLVERWFDRGWIERSWRRCLAQGLRPDHRVAFDVLPAQALRRTEEASHTLLQAARPVMSRLARAIAGSRYFAVLTDAQGTVVGVDGVIDRSDRRAQLITRIGVDLSERAVGTTAISAALTELRPVWLHRGEHFFEDTSCYSCAGAPLIGPDGQAVGMLDLTGIDAAERPELKHLVVQSARSIENALAMARPHALLLRLNWPGRAFGDEDGLLCLDRDGAVVGLNPAARQMLGLIGAGGAMHCSEVFATAWEGFFDLARREGEAREVPLWSGLTLQVLPTLPGHAQAARPAAADSRMPLKDLETELIRRAVQDARGNVMAAAKALGISRATVYRKLGQRGR